MLPLILTGLILIYSCYIFMAYFKSCNFIRKKSTVLIVTAHPDDECMFFAPAILNLLRQGCDIYLLCLSAGGFYKKSVQRKKELRESCKILGIPSENVTVIEHTKLPDNPECIWDASRVASIILKYLSQLSANVVISFDEYGVSGHLNHIAISEGLKYLNSEKRLPQDCGIFQLKSVSLLQKYLAYMTVPFCFLSENICYVSNFTDVRLIWKSMKAHESQFVWFRKLYIIFSRYVYINTFQMQKNETREKLYL